MTRLRFRTIASVAALAALTGAVVVSLQVGEGSDQPRRRRSHPMAPPFVMFRAIAPREGHGRVALLPLAPGASPEVSRLTCSRVHYAGGRGLCAVQDVSAPSAPYAVAVFDDAMTPGPRVRLDGIPTRLRVSPNGRVGAITTYAEEERPEGERLATTTRIVDMRTARVIADLSTFRIENPNLPPISGPIDLAGVAFEWDDDRFFATLSTSVERYLVAGSLSERRLSTIRTGVASEALSPDGRRLAVKRLIAETGFWQLAVIDLASWAEQDLLQGSRSVDDQVEWLDDDHVLYHEAEGEATSLWTLAADGRSGPQVLIRDAYSGVAQR